jgi:hypothetical protein
MKFKKIIQIGDEVLTLRKGRQTVQAIEYSANGSGAEPQNLTEIHASDAMNERVVFVFLSGHYCYGTQVVSIGIATEIVPELRKKESLYQRLLRSAPYGIGSDV